jgi:hypothetical protein
MGEVRHRPLTSGAALRRAFIAICALALVVSLAPATATAQAEASFEGDYDQYPFVCTTARHGLGQPQVDNHDGRGIPVAEEDADGNYPQDRHGYPTDDATIIGYSADCKVDTQYRYLYKNETGAFLPLADPAELPADVATTVTTEGDAVPYVVRLEMGTINRFIYSVAMLAPAGEADPAEPNTSLWNGRLLYSFQGGVAIGHTQGSWSESAALYDGALQQGYAVVNSTGTRTNTHYNLVRGGQTAQMVKDHFVDAYGDPVYTIGVGGSGGAIQQYVYAQNHPGLLDGGIPQVSYPDMATQTIHIGDCELLEHFMERTDAANPRWRDITERTKLVGLNAEQDPAISGGNRTQFHGLYQLYAAFGIPTPDGWSADDPSVVPLTECRPGWFGLTPLAMNPTFTDVGGIEHLAEGTDGVHWTHWDDSKDVYGVDGDGWARQTWDNVGVQYGLRSVATGALTPEEFLDVNTYVGGWKHASEMVTEGFPFAGPMTPDNFDPWSSRQMHLSPDGEAPAPRTEGDLLGIANAFANGHVFVGDIDIPMIDVRNYMEHQLDMHNTHQSFAVRQRMLDAVGHHDNQLVWFADARPGRPGAAAYNPTLHAFDVLHEWITSIQANPAAGIGGNRPDGAVDSCWTTQGGLIAAGDAVWSGILDDGPAGACTEAFPVYATSRIEAGGPITGDVYKCHTMPVSAAIAEGIYGDWAPSAEEQARLEAIFPDGVCDYELPSVARPGVSVPAAPQVRADGVRIHVSGAEPRAEIQVRDAGEVIATARTNPQGRATLAPMEPGTYVVVQVVDGKRSLLSEAVTIDAPSHRGRVGR